MKKLLIILLLFLLTSCGPNTGNNISSLPDCVKTKCNCTDFQKQEEAQLVLDAYPEDPYKLDRDKNGIACESLPATRKPSSYVNLRFGSPKQASSTDLNNYLIKKPQYALSYNCSLGIPNWVSWQLNKDWLGNAQRQDFFTDKSLPKDCYLVEPSDYTNTGYDRGHMIPSADRTISVSDNKTTFVMTNVLPQNPANNQEVWRELETYSRRLVDSGKELYIVAGGIGKQKAIADGKVTVPEYTWKVILVLEKANGKITKNTETIAVIMPNTSKVASTDWEDYLVAVDEVEKRTGYDFFDILPSSLQKKLESQVYK